MLLPACPDLANKCSRHKSDSCINITAYAWSNNRWLFNIEVTGAARQLISTAFTLHVFSLHVSLVVVVVVKIWSPWFLAMNVKRQEAAAWLRSHECVVHLWMQLGPKPAVNVHGESSQLSVASTISTIAAARQRAARRLGIRRGRIQERLLPPGYHHCNYLCIPTA